MFVLQFLILIYSVILHEIAHGWLADRLGDPTARLSGRLTLAPRPHIDLFMTILLPVLLVVSGSPVIFGAAKPIPVDPFNFRDKKKDLALTSAAGPMMNILIALFFGLLMRISPIFILSDQLLQVVQQVAYFGAQINVFLAIFNLLPLPPLDGFKVVGGLLPDDYASFWLSLERFGMMFIFLMLFLFFPLIQAVVMPVSQTLLNFILP